MLTVVCISQRIYILKIAKLFAFILSPPWKKISKGNFQLASSLANSKLVLIGLAHRKIRW
jgi:hypothetical protein